LVSHGLSLGMARADQATRDALVAAVLAAERALALAEEPSEAQLERFYASRRQELERPGPLRVQAIAVRVRTQADAPAARMRAERARKRLEAGEALETVRAQLGDPDVLALPDEPLAWDALRERLGPTTAEVLRTLSPGQVSDVLGSGSLLYVVRVLERAPDHSPPLADIREEVLARYRAQALDTALRAKLASLRSSTRIELREPPP
jgi:peptidyl-prolyl cis-trans isomerase SurA